MEPFSRSTRGSNCGFNSNRGSRCDNSRDSKRRSNNNRSRRSLASNSIDELGRQEQMEPMRQLQDHEERGAECTAGTQRLPDSVMPVTSARRYNFRKGLFSDENQDLVIW